MFYSYGAKKLMNETLIMCSCVFEQGEPPTRRAFIVVRLGEDIDSIRTCEEEEEPWQRQQLRCQQSVQLSVV
ncbi:Hypp9550 [Branchiostoma lanceolatum]|uniref:Hypp9550 protein n=1 Tax=Branchiostoma lanceolatum TaxID=7740 RepID=A0A8S4MN00_BRALA|nr:Hypp9550 [Branchiostoma lanceolatum]